MTVAAAVLTGLVVVLPATLYFFLSYQRVAGSLEAQAELNSQSITQLITANPDMWEYEQVRLAEHLSRRSRRGDAERRRVLNARGAVVAESADPLPEPWLTRALPLRDAGVEVGRIEISRSLRPLLVRSGLVVLVLLPLSLVAFRVLRTVPLEAIRRSEEALRRERDTAQRYLDIAGVVVVILGPSGRVAQVNRKGIETLERAESEVVGRDWVARFVEPGDQARVASELAALTRPGDMRALEYAVLRPCGERRILSWSLTVLADEQGSPCGLLGSGVDITKQRQLEAQLRQA